MRIKINWHSPLPEARTDIANFTARLAPALTREANVTFWTSQKKIDPFFMKHYCVRRIRSDDLRQPGLYQQLLQGINVYNMGNNADFHAHIFGTALKIPGVVIVHDLAIHHFMYELGRHDMPPWSGYLDWAQQIYGEAGREKARTAVESNGKTLNSLVNEMPFIEAILTRALGAVCHSKQALQDIKSTGSAAFVPTTLLPLPFGTAVDNHVLSAPQQTHKKKKLVIFGYIGSNRRLEQILKALGSYTARDKFQLEIFGTLWDQPLIENLIEQLGLRGCVTIHGFTAESALDQALAQADMVFNLRWPTVGEASGGILRSWHAKRPALVTDAGWYADLPDDIVIKTTPQTEEADIHAALQQLLEDPASMREIGARAYTYLSTHHTAQAYVDALISSFKDLPLFGADVCARLTLDNILSCLVPTDAERAAYAPRLIDYLADLYDP